MGGRVPHNVYGKILALFRCSLFLEKYWQNVLSSVMLEHFSQCSAQQNNGIVNIFLLDIVQVVILL